MISERIGIFLDKMLISKAKLAEDYGVHPRTFQRYLKEKRDDMILPFIPRLLEEYPRLSRQWVYFNEGPMMIGTIPYTRPASPQEIIEAVRLMEIDAKGINKSIYHYIAGLASDDSFDASENTNAMCKRCQDLENQITALNGRIADKDEIIAMLKYDGGRESPTAKAVGEQK